MSIEVKMAVTVKAPQCSGHEWLLPGEIAYVLTVNRPSAWDMRHGLTTVRCRVRCPGTGADMWLDERDLDLTTTKRDLALDDENVREVLEAIVDALDYSGTMQLSERNRRLAATFRKFMTTKVEAAKA